MFDETSRSHTDDDSTRHIHRGHRPPEEKTVEVDSAAFFAPSFGLRWCPAPSHRSSTRNEVLFC